MTYCDGSAKFSKFCEARRRFVQAVFTVFFKRVLKVSKMVVACVAVNCSNNRTNSPELSFHRLPKLNESNKQIRDRWILNVKRDGALPKDNHFFLCSEHFEKSCFERDLRVSLHKSFFLTPV